MITSRRLTVFTLFLGLIWLAPSLWHFAAAQDTPGHLKGDEPQQSQKEPALPVPVQTLVQQGGQVRYLGRQLGMDGWIAVRNGQVEYFYATPDGNALLMGMLFDKNGKLVTVRQVKDLQDKSGQALSPFVDKPVKASAVNNGPLAPPLSKFKTPSEQLYDDVSYSNWIPLGSPEAPFIYAFIDPQCPHCHDMLQDMRKGYIDKNLLQVRIVPIGFREETMLQAAYLLAAPEPQATLFKHLDGDTKALPVTPNINIQGVQRNLAIMQSWHFDVTPIVIYRGADGRIKIVRGRVKDIAKLVADMPKSPSDMTPAGGTP